MVVDNILEEREAQYGSYSDVARITQGIKDYLLTGKSYENLSNEQKLSLDMIANKMARAVNGDVNYIENFKDIAGYAILVVDSLMNTDGAVDSFVVKKIISKEKNNGFQKKVE